MRRATFALLALGLCGMTAVAGCASSRSLGASIDDMESNATLKTVLFTDRNHDYGDIDLTIFEGRLLLTGTMASEEGRRKLVENAWKAENIEQVIDEIFVGDKTRFGQGFDDSRIDTSIRAKLVADGNIRSTDVKIAVSNGVVYLLGVARDRAQLEEVISHSRTTSGVSKVVSHMVYLDSVARRP